MIGRTENPPWVSCPYCDTFDLHYMRAPDPRAPVIVVPAEEQNRITQKSFDGTVVVEYFPEDLYDRDDERSFELIRECTNPECRRVWGIWPSTDRTRDDH